jgi:signal transduction histidine kinase
MSAEGEVIRGYDGVKGTHTRGPQNYWDGAMAPVGVYTDPVTGRLCLSARTNTGHDRYPRDIRSYDVHSGKLRWVTPLGAYLSDCFQLDLDADGEMEFLVMCGSTGNGSKKDDLDDDHAYVLALETNGDRKWTRELSGLYTTMQYVVLDPKDGTPPRAIVSIDSDSDHISKPGSLLLLDLSDGSTISSDPYADQMMPSFQALKQPENKAWDVFTPTRNGYVHHYRVQNDSLLPVSRKRVSDATMRLTSAYIDPHFGAVVLGTDLKGTGYALDRELRPLYKLKGGPWSFTAISDTTGGRYLARQKNDGKLSIERLAPARFPFVARSAYILGYLILVALIAIVIYWRGNAGPEGSIEDMIDLLIIGDHGSLALVCELEQVRREAERLHDSDVAKPAECAVLQKHLLHFRDIYDQPLRRIVRYLSSRSSEYPDYKKLDLVVSQLMNNIDKFASVGIDQNTLAAYGPQIVGEITEILIRTNKFVKDFKIAHSADLRSVGDFVLERRRAPIETSGVAFDARNEWPLDQRVWGQPAQCAMLIENLINNALEAVKGADQPRISVRMLDNWNLLVLEVQDNGCGIPEDARDQIFRMGYSSRPGGTGFGLSESKRFIERYRGALRLIGSEPGVGSLFRAEFVKVNLKDKYDDKLDAGSTATLTR